MYIYLCFDKVIYTARKGQQKLIPIYDKTEHKLPGFNCN